MAASESYLTANRLGYTLNPPAGVVTAISIWNFPIMLSLWKVAPALRSATRSCSSRPSRHRCPPRGSASSASRRVHRAGVLKVVHGFVPGDVGEHLTTDLRVARITFTGASETGKTIMGAAARNLTSVSFELGGKSANCLRGR
jgi:aminomuconate-semialdehyde/2-hydroxymuconate-6-semialdehyde dehydrogenase